MKRITYISKLAQPMSCLDIDLLGKESAKNNKAKNITGVLIFVQGLFFQLLEGDAPMVDHLFEYIKKDKRHKDILCLKTEVNVEERLFPEWSMKTINLDETSTEIMKPLRVLLQNVMESHSIILKYTQPAVSKIFNQGINPLDSPLKKTDRVVLFGDIVSFSNICEDRPVEEVSELINVYLDICSNIITEDGGEVTKYLGDGIMAFYDINLADQALNSCVRILKEIKNLQKIVKSEDLLLKKLRTGFGLSCGKVMEGNIGSSLKKDYTIIGDPVNTAARLEAYTRKIEKAVVFSIDVKRLLKKPWNYLSHGEVALKGKQKSVEVFSLDIPLY